MSEPESPDTPVYTQTVADTTPPPPDAPENPQEPPAEGEDSADSASQAHADLTKVVEEVAAHAGGSTWAAAAVTGGLRPLGEIVNDLVSVAARLKEFL